MHENAFHNVSCEMVAILSREDELNHQNVNWFENDEDQWVNIWRLNEMASIFECIFLNENVYILVTIAICS